MQDNYFAQLGLPCRHTDDRTVHQAYLFQRRLWFLRQYQPAYVTEAAQRLQQIDEAYEAIRHEPDRRRYLDRLLGSSRELRDRRRSQLGPLARSLTADSQLRSQAQSLLRAQARALGLSVRDADRALHACLDQRRSSSSRASVRWSASAGPRAWSALDKFRFAAQVAASAGALDEPRRHHLMDRARQLGLAPERAVLTLVQAQAQARTRRRRLPWWTRLWNLLGGNLDPTAE